MSTPGTVLITGTTSGVGLNATCALVKRGWTAVSYTHLTLPTIFRV